VASVSCSRPWNSRVLTTVSAQVVEVGVLEGCLRTNAFARLHLHELGEQVDRVFVEVLAGLSDGLVAVHSPLGESHFHFWQLPKALPCFFSGRAQHLEDFENLADLGVAVEQGSLVGEFIENCSN